MEHEVAVLSYEDAALIVSMLPLWAEPAKRIISLAYKWRSKRKQDAIPAERVMCGRSYELSYGELSDDCPIEVCCFILVECKQSAFMLIWDGMDERDARGKVKSRSILSFTGDVIMISWSRMQVSSGGVMARHLIKQRDRRPGLWFTSVRSMNSDSDGIESMGPHSFQWTGRKWREGIAHVFKDGKTVVQPCECVREIESSLLPARLECILRGKWDDEWEKFLL